MFARKKYLLAFQSEQYRFALAKSWGTWNSSFLDCTEIHGLFCDMNDVWHRTKLFPSTKRVTLGNRVESLPPSSVLPRISWRRAHWWLVFNCATWRNWTITARRPGKRKVAWNYRRRISLQFYFGWNDSCDICRRTVEMYGRLLFLILPREMWVFTETLESLPSPVCEISFYIFLLT